MSSLSLKICKLFRKRLSGHLSERVQRRMPHGKAGKQDRLCPIHFQDAITCDETGIKHGSVSFPCPSSAPSPFSPSLLSSGYNLMTEDPAVPMLLATLETCRDSGLWWRSLPGVRRRELWVSCQLQLTLRIKVFGTEHYSSQNSFSRIWTILALQKKKHKKICVKFPLLDNLINT